MRRADEPKRLTGRNRATLHEVGMGTDLSMFGLALTLLEDGCPPEQDCHLCAMQEDDDGGSCKLCWQRYLFYAANGRVRHPYRRDAIFEGGMIGA